MVALHVDAPSRMLTFRKMQKNLVSEKCTLKKKSKMLPGKRLAAPDHAAVDQRMTARRAADRSLRNPAHRHAKRANLRMYLAYRRGDRLEKGPMTGISARKSATPR
jgi:hypothetical protein